MKNPNVNKNLFYRISTFILMHVNKNQLKIQLRAIFQRWIKIKKEENASLGISN